MGAAPMQLRFAASEWRPGCDAERRQGRPFARVNHTQES